MGSFLKKSFLFKDLLTRKDYILIGVVFMLFKYVFEIGLFYSFESRFLLPWEFLNPIVNQRWIRTNHMPTSYFILYFLITVPFVWVGFSASIRRSVNAGLSPYLSFLFFIPFVNYGIMLLLCVVPPVKDPYWQEQTHKKESLRFKTVLPAIVIAALLCVATIGGFVYFFKEYSSALFVGTPLVYGFCLVGYLQLKSAITFKKAAGLLLFSEVLAGSFLVLFAMEGVICLLMAAPIFIATSLIGAVFANLLFKYWQPQSSRPMTLYSFFIFPLLAQPFVGLVDAPMVDRQKDLMTSIVINQPPEKVWPFVVEFSELPPAESLMFKLGIAHPIRARIEGTGVGAIRYCQFTTGDFVEPITEWNEPHQLSFDVKFQPKPMKELSIYDKVHAPHLDLFLESRRGQFRLIPLEGGRTRLEGRTWYQINIHPAPYWRVFSDYIIHQIHTRVLQQVKREAEKAS